MPQRYAFKVWHIWDFFFIWRCTGRLFRFMLLQRAIESSTYQHNEETVYRRRKLWIAFVLRSRSCRLQGYQTAMSPNERKVSQRGRTDEAHRSRGIKGRTTIRLWCKEDAHVPRISALPQERDKTREKPSMAHSLNCTRYAHVHANALC